MAILLKGITIQSTNAKEFEGKLNTAIVMLCNDKVDISMEELNDFILSRAWLTPKEQMHIAMSAVMTIAHLSKQDIEADGIVFCGRCGKPK